MTAELDPIAEVLIRDAAPRLRSPLVGRERLTEVVFACGLLVATAALWLLAGRTVDVEPATAALFVAAYAGVNRVAFTFGAGIASATQLVFVPLVLLVDPVAVPLLVAVALLLSGLPDCVRGRYHPERLLLHFSDAWFAVGPAAVLVLAGHGQPSVGRWPLYLAALGAQFAVDAAVNNARVWAATGIAPGVRLFGTMVALDAALAPIGLLAALTGTAAVVAVLPLVGLLAVLAREREKRIEHTLALSEAYRGSALLMGEMLEADDAYTGGEHTKGVVALVLAVGRELRLDSREQRNLEFGALLHDIGKLRTPDEIINKPGKLTPEEWEIIKRHPVDGQEMLDRIGGVLAEVGKTVRGHHERWDGGGYPDGLAGAEIPLAARIICGCDAYNAMTTDRSYRAAMPVADALAELRGCAGTQFDPAVVEAIVTVVERETPKSLSLALAA